MVSVNRFDFSRQFINTKYTELPVVEWSRGIEVAKLNQLNLRQRDSGREKCYWITSSNGNPLGNTLREKSCLTDRNWHDRSARQSKHF